MSPRALTYAEFVQWSRNHDLQRDADLKRIAELEAEVAVLRQRVNGLGAEDLVDEMREIEARR